MRWRTPPGEGGGPTTVGILVIAVVVVIDVLRVAGTTDDEA
jgi:hypothetical protein